MRKINIWLLALISGLFLFGCGGDKSAEQAETDDSIIVEYLSDNSLTATKTSSGLYYLIETEGTGVHPDLTSTITIDYHGYLTNGETFDQTDSLGATFALSQLIEGWKEGIPYFKEGGSGKLFIPSALGYGNQAVGSIPRNSVLIFDIRLINVE